MRTSTKTHGLAMTSSARLSICQPFDFDPTTSWTVKVLREVIDYQTFQSTTTPAVGIVMISITIDVRRDEA